MANIEEKTIISVPSFNISIKTVNCIRNAEPKFSEIVFEDMSISFVKSNSPFLKNLERGDRCLVVTEGKNYRNKMLYGPVEKDKLYICH